MSTSLTWRAAHAWLRGYSDALRDVRDAEIYPEYRADYERGHDTGREKGTAQVVV